MSILIAVGWKSRSRARVRPAANMEFFIYLFALVASTMSESNVELLKAGNDQFTAKMFQEVVKANPDENIVLSAFSVLSPLAQLALGSEGECHDEILKAIGLRNDNEVKEQFTNVTKQLQSVMGVEFNLANRVYVRKGEVLNEQYAVMSRDVFNSDVKSIDFSQREAAASEINNWVANNTKNRIKNLLSPDSVNIVTSAVLVNAIYFKGKWSKPFHPSDTRSGTFYVSKDKTIEKVFMAQTKDHKYGESKELDAKLLKLPYEGDQSSLLLILPNQLDGISSLIEKLGDPSVVSNAVNNMQSYEVSVRLPQFKIETTTDLRNVLTKMNVVTLFQPDGARMVNMLESKSDLYLSHAIQKAFIEVNEQGTEAAAANAFVMGLVTATLGNSKLKYFDAWHPFYFELQINNMITFNGIFAK